MWYLLAATYADSPAPPFEHSQCAPPDHGQDSAQEGAGHGLALAVVPQDHAHEGHRHLAPYGDRFQGSDHDQEPVEHLGTRVRAIDIG